MSAPSAIEVISIDALLDRVRAFKQSRARLVQVCASRLPNLLEVTYSFDTNGSLQHLRLNLPVENPWVPSITSVYWCAFLYENEMHDLYRLQVDDMAVDFKGSLYTTSTKFAFGHPAAQSSRVASAPETKPSPALN